MKQHVLPDYPMVYRVPNLTNDCHQLGEPYVLYYIAFSEGMNTMEQFVCLSPLNQESGKNWPPFICGAVKQTGDDMQFLHPDTIQELVRLGHHMLERHIQQPMLDAALEVLIVDNRTEEDVLLEKLLDQIDTEFEIPNGKGAT